MTVNKVWKVFREQSIMNSSSKGVSVFQSEKVGYKHCSKIMQNPKHQWKAHTDLALFGVGGRCFGDSHAVKHDMETLFKAGRALRCVFLDSDPEKLPLRTFLYK